MKNLLVGSVILGIITLILITLYILWGVIGIFIAMGAILWLGLASIIGDVVIDNIKKDWD